MSHLHFYSADAIPFHRAWVFSAQRHPIALPSPSKISPLFKGRGPMTLITKSVPPDHHPFSRVNPGVLCTVWTHNSQAGFLSEIILSPLISASYPTSKIPTQIHISSIGCTACCRQHPLKKTKLSVLNAIFRARQGCL
jgi:hypothetical protein